MYLEQDRGQKNKQFYRESIEEGNDVKARQVHCQHLSSYCYTTTSTMKEASWSSDSMYARSFSAVLSSLYTHNVWKSQKSLIQYCERSELHLNSECKFWIKNTKNGQFGKFFENATFGRFSNTVYTKSLLCKANIVVCRVALRLLTFTSWLEAWGEEDLFPTTALRPRGSSRFLN